MYAPHLLIAFAIGLTIMLCILICGIVISLKRKHQRHSIEWLKQHGKHVIATVKQVISEGEWHYGSRYNRWNAWEGRFERERVWKTAYYVVADWQDPRARQVYTFKVRIDSSVDARKYVQGHPLPVIFNPRYPEQCFIELQSTARRTRT